MNQRAAELARDPGDLYLTGRGTQAQELARDPGDLLQVAPDANVPTVELSPEILALVTHIAQMVRMPLKIKIGTNAPQQTPSGFLSDHSTGNAVDLEVGTPEEGDAIAAAALVAAGAPPQKAAAMARAGGLWTIPHQGFQIQVAWQTHEGGDHYQCVHVGFESDAGTPSQAIQPQFATRRRTAVPPDEAAMVDMHAPTGAGVPPGRRYG